MSNYRSIKELVVDAYITEGSLPSYEKLTTLVKNNFPNSKWQKTHYAWYKSMIKTGRIELPSNDEIPLNDNADNEITDAVQDSVEMSVTLERDLHAYFAHKLNEIESGLSLVDNGVEYETEAGRIDILAKDINGGLVVIELKAGKANDNALGQILGYIGCLSSSGKDSMNIRGILVASSFDPRVVFAAKSLPQVKLLKYQLSFKLDKIT